MSLLCAGSQAKDSRWARNGRSRREEASFDLECNSGARCLSFHTWRKGGVALNQSTHRLAINRRSPYIQELPNQQIPLCSRGGTGDSQERSFRISAKIVTLVSSWKCKSSNLALWCKPLGEAAGSRDGYACVRS